MDDQGPGAGTSPETPEPLSKAAVAESALPAVVAVLVTHDPGPWFDETLRSLRAQSYGALSILVIDAASTESPTPRIAAELPGAYVRRVDHNTGYGRAANEVLGAVEGAAFYLLCHDDIALEPDAVRILVEEAFRSNAAIAGPKLVDWHDSRRLRQAGASVDKAGVLAPFAEPGELDQEQHDAIRDVFVVPSGCMLVRADLFSELGGFDEGIDYLGDDVDLCWRTHLAGGRVLIVPSASARHLEALGARRPDDDRRRLLARHRLRTVLSCYTPLSLLRVLPQAFVFALVEACYALAAGQTRQARDVLGAWPWNARRTLSILRRRRRIAKFRTVRDAEVRDLQVRGSARFTAFVRGQIGKDDDRLSAFTRSGRQFIDTLRARSSRAALILGGAVLALAVLGSRNLLFQSIPAIGEFAKLPSSPNAMLHDWTSGWRDAGLGFQGAAPTGLGILGLLGWVFLGATGLLRNVLIIGMLPIGFLGAWRLARPIGSLRAGIAAFVVYAAVPVPYNALAKGDWGGLVVYAAAPWVILQLARASQLAPFGRADLEEGSAEAEVTPQSRTFLHQSVTLGILLALVGAFLPFVIVVALLVALGLGLGSLLCGRPAGSGRMVLAGLTGSVIAAVVHLPWSFELLRPGAQWSAVAGIGARQGGGYSVGNLLGFDTGPFGARPLGWAFLLAGALPVVVGRGWRYQWAVRAWFVAVVGWGVMWAGEEGWLRLPLPAAEVLLAPVAAALALTVAMGMAAFEVDLPGYRFGWRQAISMVAALAVVVGVLPLLGGAVDGRWKVPDGDLDKPLRVVVGQGDMSTGGPRDTSRVLWVGDPQTLPLDGYRLDRNLTYGTTDGVPQIDDRWSGSPRGASALLGDALRLATQRRTSRLGALLAPMGVRFLVVPRSSVPVAFGGVVRPPPAALLEALAEQLDLSVVDTDPSLTVYRNTAWSGRINLLPSGAKTGDEFTDVLGADPGSWKPILTRRHGRTSWTGRIADPGQVLLAESYSANWRLAVDGVEVGRSRAFGWATSFDATDAGVATVSYRTPPLYLLLCGLQVLLWAVALVLWRRTSPSRHNRLFHVIAVEPPDDVIAVPPMRSQEELVELLSEDADEQPNENLDRTDDTDLDPIRFIPARGLFDEAADDMPHQPEEPWEPS